ncbi:CPCC family cysteine-rich protein [Ideonella lacteola]|uniref:CPCC family cysteine-rich protein n=1 Tax=Ideonella lacteola TaxID=2984193 RepID=UPI003BF96E2C
MSSGLFPCPSCGFLMFGEPPGSYEICDVCGWEDDHVQLRYPAMGGGANRLSLAASQQQALKRFPPEVLQSGQFVRAPGWRPLRQDEVVSPKPSPNEGLSYFEAAGDESPQYYWLSNPAP